MLRLALFTPEEVGLKVTATLQLPPIATELQPELLVNCEALLPEIVKLLTVRLSVPVFETATLLVVEV
jgi:hypothetical protein